jgi:prostaglandin E receptor 4
MAGNISDLCATTWHQNCSESREVKGATIVSPVIMFLAGALGNLLAITVLWRTKSEIRRTMFYTLVAGLAWTDLTGILLTSPLTIAAYANGRTWIGGESMCKFSGFTMICFGLATPLIVCAMAVERFLAVQSTYFYSKRCHRNAAKSIVVSIWLFVMLFGILPLFGFGRYVVQYPGTWCFLDFHSNDPGHNAYGYLYAIFNLALVVTMTLCNGYVMLTLFHVRYLKRQAHAHIAPTVNINDEEGMQSKGKKQHDVERQMIVLMCTITTVFAVCWAPLMVSMDGD